MMRPVCRPGEVMRLRGKVRRLWDVSGVWGVAVWTGRGGSLTSELNLLQLLGFTCSGPI